jgi:endonuclease G
MATKNNSTVENGTKKTQTKESAESKKKTSADSSVNKGGEQKKAGAKKATSTEKKPAGTEKKAASEKKASVATEKKPVSSAEKKAPTSSEKKAATDKKTTATEKKATTVEKKSTTTEKKSTATEKKATAEKKSAPSTEKKAITAEKKVTTTEKKSTTVEKKAATLSPEKKAPTAEKKTTSSTEKKTSTVSDNKNPPKAQIPESQKAEEEAEENPKEVKITFNAAEAVEKAEKAMSAIEEYVPESAKPKFSKVKKIVIAAVSGFVVLLSAAWFFCGKPIVEFGAEGFSVYTTEEPILYHIPEYLSGEYPPDTNYGEINGTGGVFNTSIVLSQGKITVSGDIMRDKTPQPATDGAFSEKPSSKSASGTKGSNPAADSGHAENSPLYFGNPTDSMPDSQMNANYLMVKPQYTLSYNTRTLCPNWAAWHLDKSNMGPADRCDDFRPDEDLPEAWYGVKKADYQYNKYGFDRGHVCPSADRTATKLDNSMTFLMTNMVPQSPDNNRVIWMHFENYERELVKAGNEVYIIAGPYGTGGTSQKGTFDEIPITLKSKEVLHMNVPAYTWKVLIAIPDGGDDISRIDEEAIIIAINVPNRMGMGKTGDWEQYICSVDEIEDMTGYDFFELLPDDVEDALESRKYVYTK